MQIQQLITDFQETLQRQLDLIEGLVNYEQKMQRAVMQKDWSELESIVEQLYALGDAVYSCEQTRHRYLTEIRQHLGLPESTRFSVVLGYLSSDRRQQIASLYRRLQIAVMRVQFLHEGIDTYITNTVETMQQIVEEVFPGTRGKIYSRDGNMQGRQMSAMVINQHL